MTEPVTGDRLRTANYVEALFGIKPVTRRRWVKDGKIPAPIKSENILRWRQSELDRCIAGK